jgi:hypothetical protein
MKKNILILLLASFSATSSFADACPNLSGTFQLIAQGHPYAVLTIKQTDCDSIQIKSTFGMGSEMDYKTDGTPTTTPQKGITADNFSVSGKYADDVLIENDIYGTPAKLQQQNVYRLDQSGNLVLKMVDPNRPQDDSVILTSKRQ